MSQKIWMPRPGPVLVVSPHPDDEVLGAGGLMRMWRNWNHAVSLFDITDGEAAFPDWPDLKVLRRAELKRALATLNPRIKLVSLGLPDGAGRANIPAIRRALEVLCANDPTLIVPYEHDGHPDHEAAGEACLAMAHELKLPIARYPVWAWRHRSSRSLPGVMLWVFRARFGQSTGESRCHPVFQVTNCAGRRAPPNRTLARLGLFWPRIRSVFTMSASGPVSKAAFEAKYQRSCDPWQFAVSEYEQRRYATTLRALVSEIRSGIRGRMLYWRPHRRTGRTLRYPVACDIAPTAVRLARERCEGFENVRIDELDISKDLPDGIFDLVIFSELGYYFAAADLSKLAGSLAHRLLPGAEFVAVHWLGRSDDHVLLGDEVHAILDDSMAEAAPG